ncbi:Uma2 family endonuclease [Mucilaginibacter ginsenosidivorax]|uniref:Uma2 family endonuclease n=1 Tax=Mucilaginibacter ginsenosidivorax TaxID=862126 RepID=A0A5B8W1C2_9SPHI|nr:Uma2 family endonuclease [Mucilaginibacter ginsenosidivorax]QEC77644.1 Uma2 family endonuclease [Mucilaginibacter ginsenosidivorax]
MQLSDLDLTKSYSYADYLQWTFDDRLELIKGKIFKMTPAPAQLHQRISWQISGELYSYLKNKKCRAYTAPFDVRLPRKGENEDKKIFTVVQPDICIICNPLLLDTRGCTGAPDIVVEILSPGNNQKELRNKYEVYQEAGVKEYWIVSPQDKTFLKYTLVNNAYQPSKLMTIGDIITTEILPGFDLVLDTVFADN